MNILFLSLLDFDSIEEHNIYTDLLRKFYHEGHNICTISPVERKKKKPTRFVKQDERIQILKLRIGNIQKTNILEKGISTVTLECKFIRAIKRYFGEIKFDLILYTTPPITLQKAIKYVKKRDGAVTYLMLKDIFPQNAVDMGMLSKTGLKAFLYRYFRNKERKLYRDSDFIGCMSQANIDFVKAHNCDVSEEKLEICPNCIEVSVEKETLTPDAMKRLKEKYGIPSGKKVLVYGGNLGRPQGIGFIIECITKLEQLEDVFVIIVGAGTEYKKLEKSIQDNRLKNTKLYQYLPRDEYNLLLKVCDVGLLFLDYRFTIPNFPSRLLGYMEAELPVLAIVDEATDVGTVIEEGEFGWYCPSRNAENVVNCVQNICECRILERMGQNARDYLIQHYSVETAYKTIVQHEV